MDNSAVKCLSKNKVKVILVMVDIDYILEMLDSRKSIDEQEKGMVMARKLKNLRVFFRPKNIKDYKCCWENCAKIIAERSDDELRYNLVNLFEWLREKDGNDVKILIKRIKEFKMDVRVDDLITFYKKKARLLNEEDWYQHLCQISDEGGEC